MKTRMFTLIVICFTAFLTFWIFRDFQKKREASSTFHAIAKDTPLSVRHLFIAPEQLGIQAWDIGDFAAYQLRTNLGSKQISFHVAASGAKPGTDFWLKIRGFLQHNKVDIDFWRLVSVKSLAPGSESTEILLANGGIPFPIQRQPVFAYRVLLEPLGEENVQTAGGTFECQHYFAHLQAPDGSTLPLLELWANRCVPPLGIVRARWQDEVLELTEMQTQRLPEIPRILSKTIKESNSQLPYIAPPTTKETQHQQIKTPEGHLASVCAQCHDDGMGGKHLKLGSLAAISGFELDLTQALYHTYAAELSDPQHPLSLQLTSQRGEKVGAKQVRFTWEKGSFWVKSNTSGRLVLSLDEIANRENIRVITRKGRFVLNVSPTDS